MSTTSKRSQAEAVSLFNENQGLIWHAIGSLSTSHVDRGELYEEGRVHLWRACLSYDTERGAFSTYAVKVIRSRLIDYLRGLNRWAKIKDQEVLETCGAAAARIDESFDSILGQLVRLEDAARVVCGAASLSREERGALERRYSDVNPACTMHVIAEEEGLSYDGAATRVKRAMAALKEFL